jgi:hypothetical protein
MIYNLLACCNENILNIIATFCTCFKEEHIVCISYINSFIVTYLTAILTNYYFSAISILLPTKTFIIFFGEASTHSCNQLSTFRKLCLLVISYAIIAQALFLKYDLVIERKDSWPAYVIIVIQYPKSEL